MKNKREVWSADAKVENFRTQARLLIGKSDELSEKRKAELIAYLQRLGIIEPGAKLEDILGMGVRDVLERRLQTLVHKKGIVNTPKDARQRIVHGHISLRGSKTSVPGTLVSKEDEDSIKYIGPQSLIEARKAPPKPKKKEEPVMAEEKPAEEKKEAAPAEAPPAAPAEEKPAEEPKPEAPAEEAK
jgi:small subunit ribosomal protein S4